MCDSDLIEQLRDMIPNGDGYNDLYFDPIYKAIDHIEQLESRIVDLEKENQVIDQFNTSFSDRISELQKCLRKYESIEEDDWLPIETLKLGGNAVLLFAECWIDPDFCPDGIREGFRNEDDEGPIFSAKWDQCGECWITVVNNEATHWKLKPTPPQEKE